MGMVASRFPPLTLLRCNRIAMVLRHSVRKVALRFRRPVFSERIDRLLSVGD
jgi:hypothetical protein